jgi:hypothetical protein
MPKTLTPEEEAIAFDKVRDKRSGDSQPLTREQKQLIREREERSRNSAENAKRENLKPFVEFLENPLAKIKDLCSQGDFASSYNKRMELFSLMTMIRTQNSLELLISLLSKKK